MKAGDIVADEIERDGAAPAGGERGHASGDDRSGVADGKTDQYGVAPRLDASVVGDLAGARSDECLVAARHEMLVGQIKSRGDEAAAGHHLARAIDDHPGGLTRYSEPVAFNCPAIDEGAPPLTRLSVMPPPLLKSTWPPAPIEKLRQSMIAEQVMT